MYCCLPLYVLGYLEWMRHRIIHEVVVAMHAKGLSQFASQNGKGGFHTNYIEWQGPLIRDHCVHLQSPFYLAHILSSHKISPKRLQEAKRLPIMVQNENPMLERSKWHQPSMFRGWMTKFKNGKSSQKAMESRMVNSRL